jgi:hypothetical protein
VELRAGAPAPPFIALFRLLADADRTTAATLDAHGPQASAGLLPGDDPGVARNDD